MDSHHPKPDRRLPRHRDGIVFAVVEALAEADRLDPVEVEYTLYEHVNPEILAELASHESGSWTFTFDVADHEVTVCSDGRLFVDGVLCRTDLELTPAPSSPDLR